MNYYDIKDRFSYSGVKHILKSPRHYQIYLLDGIEMTEAINHGQFVHTATLEADELHKRFALLPEDGMDRNKEGKIEFRSDNNKSRRDEFILTCEANGITPILKQEDWDNLLATSGGIVSMPTYKQVFGMAEREKELIWTDPEFGIKMKGKMDLFVHKKVRGEGFAIIGDIKKMQDIDKDTVRKNIINRGYHGQLACYAEGVKESIGIDLRYPIVIACEEKSQQSGMFLLPLEDYTTPSWSNCSINNGRELYRQAKEIYANCINKYGNPWEPEVRWPGVEYFSENELGLVQL